MKTQQRRDARATHLKTEASFSFGSAASYAEKDEYLAKNLVFAIKAIEFQAGRGFEGTDRWAVTVAPNDGREDEILTFGSNEKRDEQLQAAKAHIAAHGPILGVRLKLSGKAYYFETADAPQ